MSTVLDIASNGPIRIWTINLPDVGNAITGKDFITEFETAVDDANADTSVCVVILTGTGKIFSAGGNVKEMANRDGMFGLDALDQRHAYIDGIQRVPRALTRLEVPLIGAINGPAIGAGCDLAMMCDIRVASERAWFAESFVQLGLIPGDGGTWFLQRTVGYERAAEMTFTGDRVDAATALQWGMVSHVVPHDELLTEAHALAERISKNPAHALRMAKRLLQESRTGSLESTLGLAAAMQPLAHRDPEHQHRIAKWKTR
ncbi:enoyl-CoA hydratase/isomerase family protein [Mycobacterium kansasii 732]|uniref:Putative enoyl-CoA hydratase echA8 n=1 Tax=Mycobacterium pseudokansasii TaxID=2341080 RepID=A0A498QRC2_9MYCO|nr:crotonase/enoyl-CoA hydratase family protein [Mycobacterium pseudokansasii]EUA10879.1 enoyl-CoA hydratase/isomerase family protein [Mycobacterium kansasii 732]KZS61925.1 enoyl-CoA hydratase [Mycobacterium kansasii]MBY0386727.1 crotonase/enoyl-CoA hydratase family protein [Mycobacterium pseudokansasii]VAZ97675.1 putative enoyl-CoA hydratase echA8 [Mycobacterium pseudokansasii]VAZ99141.1 putative enoyl-CoA hydratase echA8 [Mycobacterium pseudokansasii]